MKNMFIPKKIKIGFQEREGTYTGKLAYIIYYDEKGKLRKEASWNNWKDDNIATVEFDNVPQSGYIFNKGVQRDGYWGSGRSVIRVYDNRDFEFEISVDNLMGILMHSDVSKRDIVEQCVFAWEGTELVLLPVNSKEYQASVAYTAKQDQKITSKELIEGYTYQAKKLETPLVYIGQREWFDWNNGYENKGKISRKYNYNSKYVKQHESKGKKHVFYDGTKFITKTPADLSAVLVDQVNDNYASLVEQFFQTLNSQKIIGLGMTNNKPVHDLSWYYEDSLYFVTKDFIVDITIDSDSKYTNNEYYMRPKIDYSVEKIEYNDSLKIISTNQTPRVEELKEIINKFKKMFNQYVTSEEYEKVEEQAKQFLLDNGIHKAYTVVLENKTEVVNSI